MKKRNLNLLSRILGPILNIQLLLSPVAYSQDGAFDGGDPTTSTEQSDTQENNTKSKTNVWENIAKGIQIGNGALNQGMQMMQQNPMNDLLAKPIDPNQLPPAIQAAGCFVFEARTASPSENMCNPNSLDGGAQSEAQVKALYDIATSNVNSYENYLVNGNESKTSQGKACLNKAIGDLQQQLKARIETLSQFEKQIEDTIRNTKKLTEGDLRALKKGDALLNGKSKDEKNNSLADFDFGKQFQNPACASFMRESNFKDVGDQGGYRAIEQMLSKNFEGSDGDANSYSPKEIFGNEELIKKDLNDLISNFDNNIQNIDSADLKIADVIDGGQSTVFPTDNKGLSNIVSNQLKNYQRTIRDKRRLLKGIPKETLDLIENGTETSADAAAIYRRQSYNRCLNTYVGDMKSFANSISNYTLSRGADRGRDSLLRTTVYENLQDEEIDIEQKIANISRLDTNPNERVRVQSSQTLCGQSIYADTRISVSKLMSLYQCECKRQYENRASGQALSASAIEKQVNGYSQYLRNTKSNLITNIKKEVENKILACPADSSTGVGALSCDKALNKSSNRFCLRTAKMCAGNMKACFDEANQKLVQTRAEQKTVAARYNKHMNQLKVNLQLAFESNAKQMEATSRQLDALYDVGSVYNSPLNIEMDQLQDKFIEGLDPSLAVEDPDAYLEIMKKDIATAKESLIKSNNEIFGADVESFKGLASSGVSTSGFLGKIAGYIDNAEKERTRWNEIKNQCNAAFDAIDRMRQESNKQGQEAYAKNQEGLSNQLAHCKQAQQFKENGCESLGVSGLSLAALKISSTQTGSDYKSAFDKICSDYEGSNSFKDSDIQVKISKIKQFCDTNQDNQTLCSDSLKGKSICTAEKAIGIAKDKKLKFSKDEETKLYSIDERGKFSAVQVEKDSNLTTDSLNKIKDMCIPLSKVDLEIKNKAYILAANYEYKELGQKFEIDPECKKILSDARASGKDTTDGLGLADKLLRTFASDQK